MEIDKQGLIERRRVRAQQRQYGVDLWISIDGADRQQAFEIVSSLTSVDEGLDEACGILPTEHGTYVWLRDPRAWKTRVEAITAELTGLGHEGVLGPAPVPPETEPHSTASIVAPTLLMVHRLDPPVEATPISDFGQPEWRWGVAPDASHRLLREIGSWVHDPGLPAMVGKVNMTPLTPTDTVDVLHHVLEDDPVNQTVMVYWPEGHGLRREINLDRFGQTSWSDVDAAVQPVDLARAAAHRAVSFAADLHVALVSPTVAGLRSDPSSITSGLWQIKSHLWGSFVPDAHGIQVLTGAHLERANDLDDWDITEVAPDRFLVQTRDLAAWFEAPDTESIHYARFPDPDLREQARADFGDMILTQANAAQHPLIPS